MLYQTWPVELGPVDVHLGSIIVAAREMKAVKLRSFLHDSIAKPLLSLQFYKSVFDQMLPLAGRLVEVCREFTVEFWRYDRSVAVRQQAVFTADLRRKPS